MNITLKQLETFVWVADLGSFRKAARRLHTTQPNISVRIAALETALNATLMERDAGSVRLTTKGASLLEHARAVLRSVESLVDSAATSTLYEGVLRLGVTEMVVHTWLSEFVKLFKARFPNMDIELTVDLSVTLANELAERAIDLAFQSGPFDHPTTGIEKLGSFPIIWVASPELSLPTTEPVTVEELSRYAVLTHARNTRPYKDVEAHFATCPGVKIRMVPSSNLAACLQMTVDGYGVAAVLAPMVEAELASGKLVEINYPWKPQSLHFAARFDESTASTVVKQAARLASDVAKAFSERFERSMLDK